MCFIWKGGGRPLKRRALHPILAEYNVTTRVTSDAEWARIVISNAEFDWFFSPEGEIVIPDGSSRIARSIEELATCMRPIFLRWRWAEPVKGHFLVRCPSDQKGIHIETWLRWHIQKLNAWEPFNSMTVDQEYSSLNMWRKPVKKGLSTHHWPFIDEPPNE